MNPRASTIQDTQNADLHTLPKHEEKEEERLLKTMNTLQKEEAVMQQELMQKEQEQEDALREEGRNELRLHKEEITKKLKRNEGQVEKDVIKLEELYKERAPKAIKEQAHTLLSLVI